MDLIKSLMHISNNDELKENKDEDVDEMSFDELIDEYMDREGMHHMDSLRATRKFPLMLQVLNDDYTDFDSFFLDNPGALESLVEWIKDQNISEWTVNIKNALHGEDNE